MGLPIFYRYLIRETATLFLAILLILLAIIMSFRLSSLLGHALSGDISLSAVWQLLGYQCIMIAVILAPVSFILAGVMTLSRMYAQQEISALFAGGIGRSHLTKIMLYLGIPLALCVLLLSLFLLPEVHSKRELLTDAARQEASYALLDENTFHRLDDGSVIHTGNQVDGKFQDFMIMQTDTKSQPSKHSVIFSDTGNFTSDAQGTRFLELGKGIRVAWVATRDPTKASYVTFTHAQLRLPDNSKDQATSIESKATRELNHSAKDQGELQNRFNPALALIIFTLCLPLLAHSGPRQGRLQKLLPAFIAFAIYINLLNTIVKAISKGHFPIWPGSLILHASVLALIGLWWFLSGRRA